MPHCEKWRNNYLMPLMFSTPVQWHFHWVFSKLVTIINVLFFMVSFLHHGYCVYIMFVVYNSYMIGEWGFAKVIRRWNIGNNLMNTAWQKKVMMKREHFVLISLCGDHKVCISFIINILSYLKIELNKLIQVLDKREKKNIFKKNQLCQIVIL